MKQLILSAIALLIAFNVVNAQEIIFYFPAQSSTLSVEQIDSIHNFVDNNQVVIDSVVGVANYLRNTRTNQSNPALAKERAENTKFTLGLDVPVGYKVFKSNKASDRRVEIFYSKVQENITKEEIWVGNDRDSLSSNNYSPIDKLTNRGVKVKRLNLMLADSTVWDIPDTLTVPTIKLDLSVEFDSITTINTNEKCDCGADMDRWAALMFYHEVLDSSRIVFKQARTASKDSSKVLRAHFQFLRDKAQGVLNCVKKSRKEAVKEAKLAGEKPPVFIRNTSKKNLIRLGGNPPCDAGDIKKEVKKASKKYHAYKQKRSKKKFSFRFKRKPRRFKHSIWLVIASRLACSAK